MRRIFLFVLLAVLLLPASVQCNRAGIVEGFYGRPWTHAERLDMMQFMHDNGLSVYVYAPKDDVYHRSRWRDPYPAEQMGRLNELSRRAAELGIDFVYAVSPGNDLAEMSMENDIEAAVNKLEAMYGIGIKRFAVFFDDIKSKDAHEQAAFVHGVDENFVKRHNDIAPLIIVPTEYYSACMDPDGYTGQIASKLDKENIVLYTGKGVVCQSIDSKDLESVSKMYDRPVGIWWNYPANDYMQEKLALGPIEGLPVRLDDVPLLLFNPMSAESLSKIAIGTGAKYVASPKTYDAERAFSETISERYGDIADEMRTFAVHSRLMHNEWADAGLQDAPEMRAHIDGVFRAAKSGDKVSAKLMLARVRNDVTDMKHAADVLWNRLPEADIAECYRQLNYFEALADADRKACDIIEYVIEGNDTSAKMNASSLSDMYNTLLMDKHAKISEKTALSFLNETLYFMNDRGGAGKI